MVPYMIPLVKKFVFSLLFFVYWQSGASVREKPLFSESTSVLVVLIGPSHSIPPCCLEHSQILLEANQSSWRKMRSYDNNSLSFVHEKHCSAMSMAEYLCWLHVISVHK